MPRLSKIRLTGCRYEGLQKEHENSIFDLTKNDKADHSLFTLCNSGGKGVMMQLIFQILLPNIRWGKNNGNKVISMFYDQRNNLYPFTFHVVLEWILDTVPEKRLITGISVKAIIKNTSSEDEEKTGLSYFLYTHEHDNNGPYTIENLPLYDKDTKEGMDLDKVEDFINDNRRDFIKYSKSGVSRTDSDYYSYLESRGIYRSEWLNLKAINKVEGGSGDYFIGAGDNKSIFDKVIIPAISENIKNYSYDDGDNLIEMFRSNLSITKDLPILIKREGDYKELLTGLEPLITNADMGSRYSDIKERLVNEGNDIYFILNDENLFADKEIEKWELEFKKTKEEKEELSYKKDNLYYNQEKRNAESKQRQATNLDKKLNEKTIEVETKKEEKTSYEINKVLYSRKDVENNIKSKIIEKEKLTEALNILDIRTRAEYLDNEIELEWDKTKDIWLNIETQQSAYINYTKGIKKENNDKKKKYIEKVEILQNDINKFELKEADLFEKKRKLEEVYDALSLVFPERILEDLIKTQEETKERINSLIDEINSYNKRIGQLDIEIVKFEYEVKNKNKSIEELNEIIKVQVGTELELTRNIARQLMEGQEGGLLNHDWFNKRLDKLENVKSEKGIKRDSIQRTIWEKSIDKILNKEDYFIPNKDISLIKEEINKIGINVQTGPEYLKEIDEEDGLELLSINPGFLYSLVIGSQKDWEIIHKNISNNLFINNMVPIYIRSQMNSSNTSVFKILHNKAYDLVNEDEYIEWKSEMQYNIESLIQTEENIKEDLSNIDIIIQEIKIINTKDTALILKQKMDKEKDEISEILEKVRLIEEEKANINIEINKTESTLSKNKERLGKNDSSIKQIEEYVKRAQEIQIDNIKIESVRKEKAKLKDDILTLDEDSDEITYNQDQTKDSYGEWQISIRSIINDVKEVYKDAIYDYKVDNSYSNYKIPGFTIEADRLNSLVGERKVIEKDIATKSTSIAVLDTEIKGLEKDRDRYIKELGELSKNWAKYEYLGLPLNELEIIINELKRNIKSIEREKTEIKSELDVTNGNIEMMKKQLNERGSGILKIHNRAPVVLDIEDINSHINIVKNAIESNRKYLFSCEEVLERNEKKRIKYQINLREIKIGYPLEINKGKSNKILKDKLIENPDSIIDEWLRSCEHNRSNINTMLDDGQNFRDRFIKDVGNKLEENKLREKIVSTVKDTNINNFKNNLISFNSMKDHFNKELLRLSNDKVKAEESMKQWTDRASMHVIKMIDALKSMVSSMNYINEEGHAFPLVKLKGIERLPKEKSEITHLLDEYFIQSVSKVLEEDVDISNIDDKKLKDIMGDKIVFSKALQGRYPTLLVYKMSEKNEFRYARSRDEYYTTWEAINKGEGDRPEGSGGQTLSVNTFVIMMIMSFKKKHIGNEKPSTVLILDNPFGKASAKHVLDPIFEIADKLNFQLICFAAPEIIKVEISERFPVFWELKIEDGKVVHGGRVMK